MSSVKHDMRRYVVRRGKLKETERQERANFILVIRDVFHFSHLQLNADGRMGKELEAGIGLFPSDPAECFCIAVPDN